MLLLGILNVWLLWMADLPTPYHINPCNQI